MKPVSWIVGLLVVAAVTVPAALSFGLSAPAMAAPSAADVVFETSEFSVVVGDRFTLPSRIMNPVGEATGPIVAHLNVVSLTDDVYVDPEDWSAERTVFVDPIESGASEPMTWEIQAVNPGRFAVYVVLIPEGSAAPVVSPQVHLAVAGRRTLSAGGALPISVAVPLVLGLAAAAVRFRLRRTA
jgi:hypothetical protein